MEERARIPKKEDVKENEIRHRQNIYVKAIGMIKQVNTMLDIFEEIGLKMDFDDDKQQYKVFAPPIRDKSLINGFNAILRRVEFNSGLAYGTLSDLNTVDKTAEEIKTSKQRSYSTVSDIQKAQQKALEQLIYAMDVIAQLSNLNGGKKYEVSFDWDDSIVIDKEQELQSMQQDATAGQIRKEIYIAAKYGESEEEALKMMPVQDDRFTIQEEQVITDA